MNRPAAASPLTCDGGACGRQSPESIFPLCSLREHQMHREIKWYSQAVWPAVYLAMAWCLLTSPTSAEAPLGLRPVPHPAEGAASAAQIELGKQLYFDPRLSRDSSISCASCHDPAKGFSNGTQFASGVGGQLGGRDFPPGLKRADQRVSFWGGRAGGHRHRPGGSQAGTPSK